MTKLTAKTLFLAAALSALAACASSKDTLATHDTTAATAATAAAGDASDPHATCVATFVRERECTDQFIPALVDMRVRLDQPPGIAAKAQTNRDGLIAEAKTEWAEDAKDDHIAEACTQLTTRMPPEHLQQAMPQIKKCLDESACDAFVACVIPVMEKIHSGH